MNAERLTQIQTLKTEIQTSMKGKEFKNLSSSDKDRLLEAVCRMLGLIA